MRAAILLAAGGSRRFGRGDKLMAMLAGRPVLLRALACARASGAARIIVVVPSAGGRVGRQIGRQSGVTRVVARRHRDGLAASLAAGLRALRPIEREALVFLGDMPFASAPRGIRLRPGQDAVRPIHAEEPGHPMLVRSAAARAACVSGDRGLGAVLERIGRVRGMPGCLTDLDTRTALAKARRWIARR
jgi:molybdenum cofactor cytidylyltransferase